MNRKDPQLTVAIASDFLTSFALIPRKQQSKVLEFVHKFKTDPTLASINYEKIKKAKDQNLRSVRIDQSYRGIVLKPEKENVFVLLWVDHHDKAYDWAEHKMCTVNPETGTLQVYEVRESAEAPAAAPKEIHDLQPLFEKVSDRHLLRLGVPEALLSTVRAIRTEADLDDVSGQLPEDAYEGLFFIASGYPLDEVLQGLEPKQPTHKTGEPTYATALGTPEAKRRFLVLEDDLELAAVLNAPLEKWRVFLHPSQRKLVERDWKGPVRVLGGAGTGKTVTAMHRAKWLVQNRLQATNDKIFFTTFTKNLAADIKENLSKICSPEEMQRIEVVNLDKWVSDFLHSQGYRYHITYGKNTDTMWEMALESAPPDLDFPSGFYHEEWDQVVKSNGIGSLDEYIQTSRLGRGIRLTRKERKAIWPVFEEYRVLLEEEGWKEPEDAMRDARVLLQAAGDANHYRAAIVDEAQDMGPQAFELLRQLIPEGPNDIFIVGDGHQRIYRNRVILGRTGIAITGRSRKLLINYRTTEENRRWAVNLLDGVHIDDLDGGIDNQKGYKSLLRGIVPEVQHFGSFAQETAFLADLLTKIGQESGTLNDTCLVARTKDLLKQYEAALNEAGIKTYRLRRSEPEVRSAEGLRLGTMHRVKGLEFDRIIIAGVSDGIVPYEGKDGQSLDAGVRMDAEIRERALLYVSATRAKREVLVTGFGEPCRFLRKQKPD